MRAVILDGPVSFFRTGLLVSESCDPWHGLRLKHHGCDWKCSTQERNDLLTDMKDDIKFSPRSHRPKDWPILDSSIRLSP